MELRSKPIADAILKNVPCVGATRVVEYQPGDGTRYELVFSDVGGGCCGSANAVLVTVVNFPRSPSMLVERDHGFLSPTYVAEKMGVSAPSAITLAEVIAHFTGREAYSPEEYRAL